MPILVSNVNKNYGEQQVLNDVSFRIGSGEVVGFIGPNGAGKSTMMKIITGFVPYETGSVIVSGWEVKTHPLETKRLIGYLPEHNPLYLEMYVKEYLQFIGKMYKFNGKINARVDEMIELTGLTPEYKKKIGQLSKGYRQRVGLAQALIHDPQVLILDEPTTGLDPNQLVDIRNLISEIGKEKTVMLSTHIMQEVSAICDRVVILNKGNIVADEKGIDILSMKRGKTHIVTIELDREIDQTVFSAIEGINKFDKLSPTLFQIESARDIRKDLSQLIQEKAYTILTLSQQERNMEDVFHELTR